MTVPPTMLPISRPMIAHNASAPKTTASAPSTIAVICMLAPNQSVNWLRGVPCRSACGTTSMERRSIRVGAMRSGCDLANLAEVGDISSALLHENAHTTLGGHSVGDVIARDGLAEVYPARLVGHEGGGCSANQLTALPASET